jgi:hypothetical protein
MAFPDVTICIPAWQAETFIDETLWCARRQTCANIRILVSIDRSEDRTEEICRRHAREDSRVDVVAHASRLGWSGNVNYLLDQVSSDYYFVYFHDDFIAPTYTEVLLARLRQHPESACAQCDVLNVSPDGRRLVTAGRDHAGPVVDRLVACLLDPWAGFALRGLMRRSIVGAVRYPVPSALAFNAHMPFLLSIFAAGPVLHVPRVLYWRPSRRSSGVERRWERASIDELVSDQAANASACLAVVASVGVSAEAREVLEYAVQLIVMRALRACESRRRARTLTPSSAVSPAFRFEVPPAGLRRQSRDTQRLVLGGHRMIGLRETWWHFQRGNVADGIRRLVTLGVSESAIGVAAWSVERGVRAARARRAGVPPFLQQRLERAQADR